MSQKKKSPPTGELEFFDIVLLRKGQSCAVCGCEQPTSARALLVGDGCSTRIDRTIVQSVTKQSMKGQAESVGVGHSRVTSDDSLTLKTWGSAMAAFVEHRFARRSCLLSGCKSNQLPLLPRSKRVRWAHEIRVAIAFLPVLLLSYALDHAAILSSVSDALALLSKVKEAIMRSSTETLPVEASISRTAAPCFSLRDCCWPRCVKVAAAAAVD